MEETSSQSPPTLFRQVLSRVLSPLGQEEHKDSSAERRASGSDEDEDDNRGGEEGGEYIDLPEETNTYDALKVIGHGSFG